MVTVSTTYEVSYQVAKVKQESRALTNTNIVINLGTFYSFVYIVIEVLVKQITTRDPVYTVNPTFGSTTSSSIAESTTKLTSERAAKGGTNSGKNLYKDTIYDYYNIKGYIVPSYRILKRIIIKDNRGNTNKTLQIAIT